MALLLAGIFVAIPARADVHLRVEAKPITDPIEALVTVTDAMGVPIGGLTVGDFIVTLDGLPVLIPPTDFTLPPTQDPNQKVSVVFAMDYSTSVTNVALVALQNAVIDFIDAMHVGDYAAIIKFNDTNPAKASVVWQFTQIDQGAGSLALKAAVMDAYPGTGTNLLDAVNLAVDQFSTPPNPLPAGPKAIIVVTDGGENASTVTLSDTFANANENSIPVFAVGIGDVAGVGDLGLLISLAEQTGGIYLPAPSDGEIAAAYASISELLNNEYLLTIPASAVTDCGQHVLKVSVAGQAAPAKVSFERCDVTPDPFDFVDAKHVALGATVTSNAVPISGITGPSPISVIGGEYSIGCGSATFRSSASMISNGDTVCVRHISALTVQTETLTTLTVGGVSGTFESLTKVNEPPKGGGGGATGAVELLLGFAALVARRRLRS